MYLGGTIYPPGWDRVKSLPNKNQPYAVDGCLPLNYVVCRHMAATTVISVSIPSHTSCVVKLTRKSGSWNQLFVLSVSEKKFMVQGEDKLNWSAQANLERNRQRFERKNKTGFDLGESTHKLVASTCP